MFGFFVHLFSRAWLNATQPNTSTSSHSLQYPHLPRQVVTPYKPSLDQPGTSHTRNPSDSSDRAPLLSSAKGKPTNSGKRQPFCSQTAWCSTIHFRVWLEWFCICYPNHRQRRQILDGSRVSRNQRWRKCGRKPKIWGELKCFQQGAKLHENVEHFFKYTDILQWALKVYVMKLICCYLSCSQKSFDFGPSLMDEMDAMFKSFGSPSKPTHTESPPPSPMSKAPPLLPLHHPHESEESRDASHNMRNELREIADRVTSCRSSKKKQATVKPISASDQRTLESAIALANELASRSMQDLDGCEVSPLPESPHTPLSPNKRKFSFKLPSNKSPKAERRNFTEEAASIPDIQVIIRFKCNHYRVCVLIGWRNWL